MATTISSITGTVREAGDIVRGMFMPRGVRLDVKNEPVELSGLTRDETRMLRMLIGKEVTITITTEVAITTEESLPGVKG